MKLIFYFNILVNTELSVNEKNVCNDYFVIIFIALTDKKNNNNPT